MTNQKFSIVKADKKRFGMNRPFKPPAFKAKSAFKPVLAKFRPPAAQEVGPKAKAKGPVGPKAFSEYVLPNKTARSKR